MMGVSLGRRMPGSLGDQLGTLVMGNEAASPSNRRTRWEHAPPADNRGAVSGGMSAAPGGLPAVSVQAIMPNSTDPMPPMPGLIAGYGGGTWNTDGTQATPVDRGNAAAGADRPDYAALLNQALGPRPELHGFRKVASIIGPALMAASGNQAGASQMINMLAQRGNDYDQRQRENAETAIKWRREDDLDEAKRNAPQYFSGNEDRVRFDPATGESTRVYDAPQDFEDYAHAQGLEAGTPEYFGAVEDYVLRGNGPTAFKYDSQLEHLRQASRLATEAARQQNRVGLENVRQGNRLATRQVPTYRDTHPQPRSASRAGARPVAKGPNGERYEFDGSAWVPAR